MLPYPNLNDQELDAILAAAIDRLRQEDGDWNTTGDSDPGIFLLELLARMKYIQQGYINQIGVKSFYKFASLLGLSPRPARAAKTYICFGNGKGTNLAKGSRLAVEDLIYETTESIQVIQNRLVSLGHLCGENIIFEELLPERSKNGYALLPYEKEGAVCYLNFEQLLPDQIPIRFYFEIVDEQGSRQPLTDPDNFVPLSEVKWEYYGIINHIPGWYPCNILRDETYAFLFPGQVLIQLPEPHSLVEDKSLLRIRTVKYGYESVPRVSGIRMNCVCAEQKRTLCKEIRFSAAEVRNNQMFFNCHLAEDECYQLYLKKPQGFLPAETLEITYLIRKEENGCWRLGTSERNLILEHFSDLIPEETALLLVLYDKEFYPKRFLGSGTGIGNQTIIPEVNGTILSNSLQLLLCRKGFWERWERRSSLDAAGPEERIFIFSERTGQITFGDNIHGKTPYLGTETICLIGCAITAAERGNVREGAISDWFQEEKPELSLEQFLEASGGKSEESREKFQERVRAEKNRLLRAVTAQDYEQLVKQAQGLKLAQVTAVPLYRPGIEKEIQKTQENSITLIIEAVRDKKIPFFPEIYLENIRRWIEPYRLLTTRLYLMTPRFFGLELDGELEITGGLETAAAEIQKTLITYLENREKGRPGGIISQGDLCGSLERLSCVEHVEDLRLELKPGVPRNRLGDLLLPPYGRVYLKSNRLHLRKLTGSR